LRFNSGEMNQQSTHVAAIIKKTIEDGAATFEVTEAAENGWVRTMREKMPPIQKFLAECTPGYLNNEGNVDESALRLSIYGAARLNMRRS